MIWCSILLSNSQDFDASAAKAHRQKFVEIATMDYEYSSINERKHSYRKPWRRAVIVAILTASSLAVVILGFVSWKNLRVSEPDDFTCGETLEEARQRGCTFDSLTLTWLHPACSLHGHKEFLESSGNKTWQFWEDKHGSVEHASYESLSLLPPGTTYYVTQGEHLNHCMWNMLRVHDALVNGRRLDVVTSKYHHSKHCLSMLVEQATFGVKEDLAEISVAGRTGKIGFNSC